MRQVWLLLSVSRTVTRLLFAIYNISLEEGGGKKPKKSAILHKFLSSNFSLYEDGHLKDDHFNKRGAPIEHTKFPFCLTFKDNQSLQFHLFLCFHFESKIQ